MRELYVYILANRSRALYVGVTNDLRRRVDEHRKSRTSFTSRYRITRLVYFERLGPPIVAIAREKHLKRISRQERLYLIEKENPEWRDLAEAWFRFPFGSQTVSVQDLSRSARERRRKARRSGRSKG